MTAVKVTRPLFWTMVGVAVFVTAIDGGTSTISTVAVASSLFVSPATSVIVAVTVSVCVVPAAPVTLPTKLHVYVSAPPTVRVVRGQGNAVVAVGRGPRVAGGRGVLVEVAEDVVDESRQGHGGLRSVDDCDREPHLPAGLVDRPGSASFATATSRLFLVFVNVQTIEAPLVTSTPPVT